jgi:hypothetical protein
MQPLAHSPVSPVFKRPKFLPLAGQEGDICEFAGGRRRQGSVEWNKYIKTMERQAIWLASPSTPIKNV